MKTIARTCLALTLATSALTACSSDKEKQAAIDELNKVAASAKAELDKPAEPAKPLEMDIDSFAKDYTDKNTDAFTKYGSKSVLLTGKIGSKTDMGDGSKYMFVLPAGDTLRVMATIEGAEAAKVKDWQNGGDFKASCKVQGMSNDTTILVGDCTVL
jgi:hypothetical protein